MSLLSWIAVGYPWPVCVLAVLPLLAPLHGLVRGRRYTYAWATLFAVPYLAFAVDRAPRESSRALGRRIQPAFGVRLVLHYGFILACLSSASRMKGMVSRRCATRDASSNSSRISRSEGRSRGMRFSK